MEGVVFSFVIKMKSQKNMAGDPIDTVVHVGENKNLPLFISAIYQSGTHSLRKPF